MDSGARNLPDIFVSLFPGMRNFVSICSALFVCLLFAAGGRAATEGANVLATGLRNASVHAPEAKQAPCIDRASAAEWLCERTCNSDLNLPRVCADVSASWASPAQSRTAGTQTARASLRRSTARHDAHNGGETSCDQPFDLSAGPHAVDYYVYRLRRLII